jgi:hypothetical protein
MVRRAVAKVGGGVLRRQGSSGGRRCGTSGFVARGGEGEGESEAGLQ